MKIQDEELSRLVSMLENVPAKDLDDLARLIELGVRRDTALRQWNERQRGRRSRTKHDVPA